MRQQKATALPPFISCRPHKAAEENRITDEHFANPPNYSVVPRLEFPRRLLKACPNPPLNQRRAVIPLDWNRSRIAKFNNRQVTVDVVIGSTSRSRHFVTNQTGNNGLVPKHVKTLFLPCRRNGFNGRTFGVSLQNENRVTLLNEVEEQLAVLWEHVKLCLSAHVEKCLCRPAGARVSSVGNPALTRWATVANARCRTYRCCTLAR